MGIEEDAYRYAIKNAFLHNYKADISAVIGKLKALYKEAEIGEIIKIAKETVEKVNNLDKETIEREFEKYKNSYELKPKEREDILPKIEIVEKEGAIVRFAPNPNGPLHIGHARTALLNYEFVKRYGGKFILRFDDTDPKIKPPLKDVDKIIIKELEWLGCKIDEIVYASDRLEVYYKYMEKLIKIGKAYVCVCNPEEWRKLKEKGKACKCRELSPKEHLKRFKMMKKNEFKEGEAVLRIKTDLKHKDTSVRDWWIAKVVDNPRHWRVTDKHVWPSYNFASAIDDHEFGINLIIRGQEHTQNTTKQKFLYEFFNWRYPETLHTGRIRFGNLPLSTSKIRGLIENGQLIGWDDPRTGMLAALKRRGFKAEALREALLSLGAKPNDATIDEEMLAAYNRKHLVDAKRLPFIEDPIVIEIINMPQKEHEIENIGVVQLKPIEKVIVEKKNINGIKIAEIIRLREFCNIKIRKISELVAEAEFITFHGKKEKNIPWILEERAIDVEIMMPDAKQKLGITDKNINKCKENEVVHLDNLGFAKIDELKEGIVKLWFAHH